MWLIESPLPILIIKFFVSMYFSVFLIIFQLSATLASQVGNFEYPVHIHELGDFVVQQPVLENRPDGAVILPPPSLPSSLLRPRSFSLISQPAPIFLPLEAISTYLMEETVPRMMDFLKTSPGKAFRFTERELHFINVLKYHTDHFNPSILDGIIELERIVAFGAVFLRIFKAAYPGLFRVQLSREEIIDLALIATGWFMEFKEENENYKDYFLLNCLEVYSPNSRPGYNFSMFQLYINDRTVAFEAAVQLNLKEIPNRNMNFVLPELKVENAIYHFLHNRELFLRLLPCVRDINDAEYGYEGARHILFIMIIHGLFYPEAMLRPELKDFRIHYDEQNHFEDFYSEALYLAIANRNSEALTFLLNLDDSYYEVEREEEQERNGYDSDSSMDTVATPYTVYHPRPIPPETLNNLRLIFFNDQVLELFPEVYNYKFLNFSIFYLMNAFKNTFPNLMLLQQNYNFVMEEKHRLRASPSVGEKRSLENSDDDRPDPPKRLS